MNYTVVLNGCSRTVQSQAEELAAFIETNLGAAAPGRCIIFYSAPEKKDELAALFPAEYLLLVRVERYQPEFFLSALARLAQDNPTPLYLFPGGYSGSELAVRLACRLGAAPSRRCRSWKRRRSRRSAAKQSTPATCRRGWSCGGSHTASPSPGAVPVSAGAPSRSGRWQSST